MKILTALTIIVLTLTSPVQAATICQNIGGMIYCTSTPDPTPQSTVCTVIGGMLYCS